MMEGTILVQYDTGQTAVDLFKLKYTSNVPAQGAGTSTPKVMTTGKTTATPKITFFANC